ncbi:hypothetical protein AB1Y20_004824 [Prymnesium parvum]|uniref:Coenzyme Q-binding protein COQ10 START domain-containing protein n=1 Tax=Prymnesium parvum TaxID=97485 RepID=A0AB34J0D4_PRYPA
MTTAPTRLLVAMLALPFTSGRTAQALQLLVGLLPPAAPFAAVVLRLSSSPARHGRMQRTELLTLSEVQFKGAADTQITIPRGAKDLGEWLASEDSRVALLGSGAHEQKANGRWVCRQPPVGWFGVQLLPVFISSIEQSTSGNKISVRILESRTEVQAAGDSFTARTMSAIMERVTISGDNTFTWRAADDGWHMRAKLQLTFSVPIPPFLPVPPGFNSIGSRIVQSTCQARLTQTMEDVRTSFLSA